MFHDPDTCPHPDPVDELDGWFRCPRCGVEWNDPQRLRPSSRRARSDAGPPSTHATTLETP